ncbi:MAG: hypothetical protein JJ921_16800 [Pseudomonadales bacterium]|nr:hypothetical protein [Pseudomonadales bacterium]
MTHLSVNRLCALFILFLLVSCGGGSSDSSENIVVDPPEPPQDGIAGSVAAGISGAQISVQDANGEDVVVASGRNTNSNGVYRLVFSEFEILEGITAPFILTLDGSGATAVCDFDQEGDNDCLTREGNFAAYGETYNLPDGFTLRALAPTYPPESDTGDRLINVNFSAASDLAAALALDLSNGNPLNANTVELANRQALGFVEFTSGLSTSGSDINSIDMIDLPTVTSTPTSALALALFSASLHGQVDIESSNVADYRSVVDQMISQINPTETGNLRATGTYLSRALNAFIVGGTSYQSSLTVPSPVLAGALASRQVSVPLLEQTGNGNVNIALPADPNSTDALDRGRTMINRLSEAMGSTLLVSPTIGFGGTASGADLVYSDQVGLIATLVSQEMRTTIVQLDDAITEAVANGETELTGTNVSGVLEVSGDTVTLTTVTSSTSNIQTGISINMTVASGTRTNTGSSGIFEAGEITISVSRTQDDLTTQQLYTGSLTLQMTNDGTTTDVSTIDYSGTLRATSGLEFSGHIALSHLSPGAAAQSVGTYDTLFSFVDGSQLSMSGKLETQIDQYTVTSGASTIMVDLITNMITDMNATLNLRLDSDANVTGGTLVATEQEVGTLTAGGIVEFTDDTATSLPSPII